MKKTAILLLALITALSMACCQQKENTSATEAAATPDQSQTERYTEPGAADTTAAPVDNTLSASEQDAIVGNTVTLENFPTINQLPELPTGCEVTSLTMALNYCGVSADKCDIADNYLEKGEVGTVDFRVAFEGDPRDENSFGCYAPVIEKAANSYLEAHGSQLRAEDITGVEFEQLFSYLDENIPVIVWGTVDCEEPVNRTTWVVDGKELRWYSPEHCMVLVGYGDTQVTVADPLKGALVSFDRETFKSRFYALFQQAIVIK